MNDLGELKSIDNIIKNALAEDLSDSGDVTTRTVAQDRQAEGVFKVKENGIVAGLMIIRRCFELYDNQVEIELLVSDGDFVQPGTSVAKVKGLLSSLLTVERTVLNFLCHLSGIASITYQFIEKVKPYKAQILDTRKTTPGLRMLEKYAVKIGGGINHRFGLYDMVLIKDNHKQFTDIATAIKRAKKTGLKVEVETDSFEELKTALTQEPDVIMLDNMGIEDIKAACQLAKGKVKLEASGNVTLENVEEIAKTGVDYISVGAITHSAKALDISFTILGS
ncbi:MAG: carboxylating nicotinate-nucleotide diphosphorylase [Actinobacteria bacterium]|nr:MAG: carboxylating nicotinate-nucleotide diphosphorylase [Actinomycetota bacterium]